MPCGGCIRRQCPDACHIDNDDNDRVSARATSHDTTSANTSQLFPSNDQSLSIFSERQQFLSNEYMAFPSETVISTRSASQDRIIVARPGIRDTGEGHNVSSERDAAHFDRQAQRQQPLLDDGTTAEEPSTSLEPLQAQSIDSGPSANVGSLRLDTGGRSRYFGPTAASQWLRDVRDLPMARAYSRDQPSDEADKFRSKAQLKKSIFHRSRDPRHRVRNPRLICMPQQPAHEAQCSRSSQHRVQLLKRQYWRRFHHVRKLCIWSIRTIGTMLGSKSISPL